MNGLYKKIIENYIKSYNSFDTNGMLNDMDENIFFENISNGETNVSIEGIDEFKDQADLSARLFRKRKQIIKDIDFDGDLVEVQIDFIGILAVDLSDELKAGSRIEMRGKSIFRFENKKIIELTDIT